MVDPSSGQLETDYVVSQLFRRFDRIEERLDRLEAGGRTDQLSSSSVDTDRGKGFISFYQGGVEKTRIGRMPDGTVTNVSVNNTDPPSVPDSNSILVQPVIGGLIVAVEKLEQATPYDFSHLNIYVNGLKDGTITRIPGYWLVAPLDTGSTHNIQVTAVNQSGTESAKSIGIIARPLRVVDEIALGEIKGTLVEEGGIKTPQLAALAITAAKIAVNAVNATHIQAGSITAQKLAAMIVMAQKRFICGDPTGKRLEINDAGIEQYNELGVLLLQLGAGAVAGNFLTVPNPNDPYDFLATFDEKGVLSLNGLKVWGDPEIYGKPLSTIFDQLPRGIQSYGQLDMQNYQGPGGSSSFPFQNNTEYGLYELSANLKAGRMYKISAANINIERGETIIIQCKFTQDGSKPNINSQVLGYTYISSGLISSAATGSLADYRTGTPNVANDFHTHAMTINPTTKVNAQVNIVAIPGNDVKLRLLFTTKGAYTHRNNIDYYYFSGILQFFIEDIGLKVTNEGSYSAGGGNTNELIRTKEEIIIPVDRFKVWRSNQLGAPLTGTDAQSIRQGGDNPDSYFVSKLGFDPTVLATLDPNTTIVKAELYLYASFFPKNTGGRLCLYPGTNYSSNVFSAQDIDETLVDMKRPEGKWIELPVTFMERIKQGQCDSISLFPGKFKQVGPSYLDPIYNAIIANYLDTTPDKRPKLRVTYTKPRSN